MTKRPIMRDSILIINSATNKLPIAVDPSYVNPMMIMGVIMIIIPITI